QLVGGTGIEDHALGEARRDGKRVGGHVNSADPTSCDQVGDQQIRVRGIDDDIAHAGIRIRRQSAQLFEYRAVRGGIAGTVHTSAGQRSRTGATDPGNARGGADEDDVGVCGVDLDAADRAARNDIRVARVPVERPGNDRQQRAGIVDTVDADAEEAVGRKTLFAGTHVERVRLRRCDRQRADGQAFALVHQRRPVEAAIDAAVETAVRGTDIDDIRIGRMDGDGDGSPGNRCAGTCRLPVRNRCRTDGYPCGPRRAPAGLEVQRLHGPHAYLRVIGGATVDSAVLPDLLEPVFQELALVHRLSAQEGSGNIRILFLMGDGLSGCHHADGNYG